MSREDARKVIKASFYLSRRQNPDLYDKMLEIPQSARSQLIRDSLEFYYQEEIDRHKTLGAEGAEELAEPEPLEDEPPINEATPDEAPPNVEAGEPPESRPDIEETPAPHPLDGLFWRLKKVE